MVDAVLMSDVAAPAHSWAMGGSGDWRFKCHRAPLRDSWAGMNTAPIEGSELGARRNRPPQFNQPRATGIRARQRGVRNRARDARPSFAFPGWASRLLLTILYSGHVTGGPYPFGDRSRRVKGPCPPKRPPRRTGAAPDVDLVRGRLIRALQPATSHDPV